MNLTVKPNFKVVGKVFGPLIKEFQQKLEKLDEDSVTKLQKAESISDTTLTEELVLEGMAREMVSKVQNLRKICDFHVADRITLYYSGDEKIDQCVTLFAEYIKSETLATSIVKKEDLKETYDLNGHTCSIAIER